MKERIISEFPIHIHTPDDELPRKSLRAEMESEEEIPHCRA